MGTLLRRLRRTTRKPVETRECCYCGDEVSEEGRVTTDVWDLDNVGIEIGTWMCADCACK